MPFPHWIARMKGTPVSSAAAATSIIFVTSKDVFCRDKTMFVVTNIFLSRQAYFYVCRERVCRDKTRLLTKVSLSRQKFSAANVLSRQAYFCVYLVKTRLLTRQKYACRDESFVATIFFYTCCSSRQRYSDYRHTHR